MPQVRSRGAEGLAGRYTYSMSNEPFASSLSKLLQTLKARFERNMHRHKGIAFAEVQARLEGNRSALVSLEAMEASGGEPDVIGRDKETAASPSAIAPPKARPVAGASVTTVRRSMHARSTSRKEAPSTWPPKWVPSC